MCGRYAVSASPERLAQTFDVDDLFDGLGGPDYNVAPTVAVPAVFERRVKETGEVRRRLAPLVWGLVPSWAKDRSIGARLINARWETLAEKPAFRKAFAQRRCLLPADGFYEWYVAEAGSAAASSVPGQLSTSDGPTAKGRTAKTPKQPFFIRRHDAGLLVMAGLYEIWRDPGKDRDDDSAWLRTCSVITTEATDAVGHIHDRMPMVVAPDRVDDWLDPGLHDPAAVRELLAAPDAAALEIYAVSTAVNRVQNNDSSLIQPLAEEFHDPVDHRLTAPPDQPPLV